MIDVVMTGTYEWWQHFIDLRIKDDAQWEIAELARAVRAAMPDFDEVGTSLLDAGVMFHIPYVSEEERNYFYDNVDDIDFAIWAMCAVSSARCARVSYTPFGKMKPDISKDFNLFEKLVSAEPMHASPLEHAAISQRGDVWKTLSGPQTIFKNWATFRSIWETAEDRLRRRFFEACRTLTGA